MTILASMLLVAAVGAGPTVEFVDTPYFARAGHVSGVVCRVKVVGGAEAFDGTLVVSPSKGIAVKDPRSPVSMPANGEQVVEFSVEVPKGAQPRDYCLTAVLDGTAAVAHAVLRVVEFECPEGLSAGVVGDAEVWLAAFARLGVKATALASSDCTQGRIEDLALVVIAGDLTEEAGDALGRYVQNGGKVLIPANGPGPWQEGLALPRVEFAKDAVDLSGATLRAVEPPHPVTSQPNATGASEWQDWPMALACPLVTEWDAAFSSVVECVDTQGGTLGAAVLVAATGKGCCVLCSMPYAAALAGIDPAALRLLVNMLAL